MSEGTENQSAETVDDDVASVMAELEETEETEVTDETEEETTDEVEEETEEETEDEESEESDEESGELEEEKLEAPQHWAAKHRELFSKQPREVQDYLLSRHKDMEADYTRKTQEISDIRKRAETSEEVWGPLRQQFAMMGMDDVTAQRQLATVYQNLQTNPAETVMWLAQQYGVDFSQEQEIDPAIQSVKQELNELKSQQYQNQQAQHYAAQQQATEAITTFRDTKDESGNPKYPHFETVKESMGKLMSIGTASNLEDAYDKAIRLDPNLFNSIQQDADRKAKEAAAAKQAQAKKAAAAKAKKAASGVKGGTTGKKTTEDKSLTDEVSELVNQAYG